MKKLIITFVVALAAVSVSAQEAGKMWVGGSVGLSSSKPKGGESTTSYSIVPEFGYFIQENLAIAISAGYSKGSTTVIDEVFDGKTFSIKPFVRYSFLHGSVGNLFIDGGAEYKQTEIDGFSDKMKQINVGFNPGIAINVTDNLAVTGKFGFLGYENTSMGDDAKVNSFGLNLDMSQFLFGVSYVF